MQPIEFKPMSMPRIKPQQRLRPVQKNIPAAPAERARILQSVRHYVAEYNPVPPLPTEQLAEHARRVIEMLRCDPVYQDYIAVLVNNEMWRETLAAIPFERRLLLLPKCLRVEDKCPAPFDEFGLLCKHCGLCSISDLQVEAEGLGYAVLVAEGSALVTSMIQTGKIDAVVGVSCLNVLERAFPYMEAAAIPGVAIPLLQDDCADTNVDLDWVWDYIHLTSEDQTRRLDLTALREEIDRWFSEASLAEIMGPASGKTDSIGRQWLARAGKRWRPFLAVAAHQALRCQPDTAFSPELRKLAIAVECFHKASLIHDDIEDNDATRYGEKTLHEEHGLPIALNVGDLLIGEGYRLIGECHMPGEILGKMLTVAAQGQRQLCLGQGAELCWLKEPAPLKPVQVLDIFRQKTAPAFEVALKLGALFASGAPVPDQGPDTARQPAYEELAPVLFAFSEAMGIAYQVRDDLDDFAEEADGADLTAMRPSVVLALTHDRVQGLDKTWLAEVWRQHTTTHAERERIRALATSSKSEERAQALLETYKQTAIDSLRPLEDPNLKGLLRRIIGRIFNQTEIKGWCREFEDPAAIGVPGQTGSATV
jgi:geranylgeranyl pyrophosphate synthase